MKKTILILIALMALILPVSANAVITYYFKDRQGNYLDDVNVLVYTCQDSSCSQVTIPNHIVPNYGNSNDYGLNYDIDVNFPTNLESLYGYALFYTKSCYLPVESSATWHGNGATNYNIYFDKKEDAIAEINNFEISNNEVNVNKKVSISADIKSAFEETEGKPEYTPASLKEEFYSALTDVTLTVSKNNEIIYSESRVLNIYMGETKGIEFEWIPSELGTYEIKLTSLVSDCQVSNSIMQVKKAVVSVLENQENHAPVLEPIDDIFVSEGDLVIVEVNAYDQDNDVLTYFLEDDKFVQISENTFEWQTQEGDNGDYYFKVKVEDEHGASDTGKVFVKVLIEAQLVNQPELELIGNKHVYENDLLTFQVNAYNTGLTDYEYTAEFLPEGASFDVSTKTFSWKPSYNVVEHPRPDFWNKLIGLFKKTPLMKSYYVKFIVSNGKLEDYELVRIDVYDVNRNPELIVNNLKVYEGELAKINYQVSDADLEDQDWLKVSFESPFNKKGIWQTKIGDVGIYSINVNVDDGFNGQDNEIVIVEVLKRQEAEPEYPPVLNHIGDRELYLNEELRFMVIATDRNNDILIYSAQGLPNGAEFENQLFSWKPRKIGNYYVKFIVSDGYFEDSETIKITVKEREILGKVHKFSVNAYPLDLEVKQGDSLIIYSKIKNEGLFEEDLKLRLSCQELGLIQEKDIVISNGQDSYTGFFELEIPENAKKGDYLVKVSAYNNDYASYKLISFEII